MRLASGQLRSQPLNTWRPYASLLQRRLSDRVRTEASRPQCVPAADIAALLSSVPLGPKSVLEAGFAPSCELGGKSRRLCHKPTSGGRAEPTDERPAPIA